MLNRNKIEEIILKYGILEETFCAIMMIYKNNCSMVRSPDGDLRLYELGFILTERKSIRYPGEQITDTDYADDIAVTCNYLKNASFRVC